MKYLYESEMVKAKINNDERISNRKMYDTRDISVELNTFKNANGSAILTLGKTKVIAGVKILPDKPFPDNPDEGSISIGIEMSAMADESFDTGPPSEDSIELSRVVDRAIRESGAIDFKSLGLVDGEVAWFIFIDIYVMNNDGNLFDACELAALAALKVSKFPKLDSEYKIVKDEFGDNLKLDCNPILFTFGKIGDKVVLDPDAIEECAMSARFSISIIDNKKIVAIQKGLEGSFKLDEIREMVNVAIKKHSEQLKKLEEAIKENKRK